MVGIIIILVPNIKQRGGRHLLFNIHDGRRWQFINSCSMNGMLLLFSFRLHSNIIDVKRYDTNTTKPSSSFFIILIALCWEVIIKQSLHKPYYQWLLSFNRNERSRCRISRKTFMILRLSVKPNLFWSGWIHTHGKGGRQGISFLLVWSVSWNEMTRIWQVCRVGTSYTRVVLLKLLKPGMRNHKR